MASGEWGASKCLAPFCCLRILILIVILILIPFPILTLSLLLFFLELVSRAPAGSHDGSGRVSQVPERPSCPYALFLGPGRTDAHQAIAASRHGPRLCQQRRLLR